MRNYLYKKNLSFLLATLFFVVSFASFASTSSAAIADDLRRELALPVTAGQLSGIAELPGELGYDNTVNVLDSIVNTRAVTIAKDALITASLNAEEAQNTWHTQFSFAGGGFQCKFGNPPGNNCNGGQLNNATVRMYEVKFNEADAAKNTAVETLRQALITARKNHQDIIDAYIAEGQAKSFENSKIQILTDTTDTGSEGITGVSNVDNALQAGRPNLLNPADIEASRLAGKDNAEFAKGERDNTPDAIGSGGGAGGGGAGGEGSLIVGADASGSKGTGVDGALTITSGTTNINLGGAPTYTKNYSSISITGTGQLAFSNPHPNGTTVKLLSTGAVTRTSSKTPDIDASGIGGAGGTGGGSGASGGSIFSSEKDKLAADMHATCSILPTRLMPCIAEGVYYAFYKPASFALAGAGMIFDFVLMLSIDNSKNMVAPAFIDEAWTVVRDFSNMLFIFVLLYTGIMTMFGMADWKKVVIKVVVVALLINFSLFFTKVVIDAGNVLAIGIKSAIGNESLSAGLVDSFKPQMFLKAAAVADKGKDEALNAIIVFIIAGIVSGFAAYYFFKAALLFFGRLLGFWFLMIVSPFVFISTALPSGDKLRTWFDSLIGLTFAAPVFLFLIYLLTIVLSAGDGIMSSFSKTGTGWFNSILGPVMAATLVILALKKTLELTEKMAGDFGKLGADMANVAMTGAMGVSGIVARQTLGRAAAKSLRDNPVKSAEEIAKMGTMEKLNYNASLSFRKAAASSSFDVRNFGDKNSLIGKTMSGKIFQKEQGVGGREKVAKEADKKATDNVPELSIFEKQGIRDRAQEKAEKEAKEELKKEENDAELKLTEATQKEKEAIDGLTAQLKASEDAEKERDETGKARSEAKAVYDTAVRERMRGGGGGGSEEAVTKAKLAFETADTAHSSATLASSSALSKIEEAKKATKEASEALETAKKAKSAISSETPKDRAIKIRERATKKAESKAKEEIAAREKENRISHADKVEKGGWFGVGKNKTAADKIRKGEESGQAKELKKLAKEKKDAEEAGKGEDVIKHIDEKIEKEKAKSE